MGCKYPEHGALIVGLEVEEAVPRQYSVKPPADCQRAHIRDQPLLIRHSASAQRDQGWRAVDARDLETMRNQAPCNRHPAAAAEVKYCPANRKRADQAIDPALVVPAGRTTIRIPCKRMALVVAGDQVGGVGHVASTGALFTKWGPAAAFHCGLDINLRSFVLRQRTICVRTTANCVPAGKPKWPKSSSHTRARADARPSIWPPCWSATAIRSGSTISSSRAAISACRSTARCARQKRLWCCGAPSRSSRAGWRKRSILRMNWRFSSR